MSFCDEEMLHQYYQNHIDLCQQQIGNYNLIEQQCQQCGEQIIKLYQNDHLEICPGNFWIEVKCPYCSSPILKAYLKEHITQCNIYIEQQQREIKGIKNCSICLEDILEKRADLKCSHSFHQECIENWLKQRQKCPICKRINDKAYIQ
ncbi:unnamed protein product [Paramecium primaurelia]|uniref:RING-type domain-containing protein n=1 Tax=Paramecium primaurelia TaxID=5886 RepID=A0A8S1PRH9_PARPR|nr:unnamed protein product [Paramecium primaurelia]